MIEKHRIRAGMLMVRPDAVREKTTASGLVLPTMVDTKEPNHGDIVIAGKPLVSDPHDLKKGDKVYYGERAGQEITLYEIKYRLIQSKEIMSYIPKEEIN
jgi:co-chaperonin GroES (HSP10)